MEVVVAVAVSAVGDGTHKAVVARAVSGEALEWFLKRVRHLSDGKGCVYYVFHLISRPSFDIASSAREITPMSSLIIIFMAFLVSFCFHTSMFFIYDVFDFLFGTISPVSNHFKLGII